MADLAESRGHTWDQQREFLVSSSEGIDQLKREAMKQAASVETIFAALDEGELRALIARVLAAKSVFPFEMKGARQARVVAEAIVAIDGVPDPFDRALRGSRLTPR